MAEAARRATIFFSVGEPSGDLHAANLIRALRAQAGDAAGDTASPAGETAGPASETAGPAGENIDCVGFGGPKMAAAGCRLLTDLTAMAVMGIFPVLVHLHRFVKLLFEADRYFRDHRPDAVVLVDFPGFNWWIARRAKAHGIPVIYYVPPQLWAWLRYRVKKMRRLVDHVLCALPFEADWFREQGCHATFMGHPYFDEVARVEPDASFVRSSRAQSGRLVTILPGSRGHEVRHNLPWLLKAARRIQEAVPDTRLAIASFKPSQAEVARQMVQECGVPAEVYVGRTPELIAAADCCMAVSGSVSLELLWHTRPTVILYHTDYVTGFMARLLVRVRYMTLVNLLVADRLFDWFPRRFDPAAPDADRVPMPEYPTCSDKSAELAAHVVHWLTDEPARQAKVEQLRALKAQLAHGGASQTAAAYIRELLAQGTPATDHRHVPQPHFHKTTAVGVRKTGDSRAQ